MISGSGSQLRNAIFSYAILCALYVLSLHFELLVTSVHHTVVCKRIFSGINKMYLITSYLRTPDLIISVVGSSHLIRFSQTHTYHLTHASSIHFQLIISPPPAGAKLEFASSCLGKGPECIACPGRGSCPFSAPVRSDGVDWSNIDLFSRPVQGCRASH